MSELYILDIRQEDEGIYYCRSAFSLNTNMSTFEDINLFFAFMEVEGKDKSLFFRGGGRGGGGGGHKV